MLNISIYECCEGYNATMSKSEKIKKISLIVVMLAASGYFLYTGFSILFEEETPAENSSAVPLSDN